MSQSAVRRESERPQTSDPSSSTCVRYCDTLPQRRSVHVTGATRELDSDTDKTSVVTSLSPYYNSLASNLNIPIGCLKEVSVSKS